MRSPDNQGGTEQLETVQHFAGRRRPAFQRTQIGCTLAQGLAQHGLGFVQLGLGCPDPQYEILVGKPEKRLAGCHA